MTTLRSAQVVVCAGALAIAAGCSKSPEPEETAPPEPAVTEGSEAQDATSRMDTSGRDTTYAPTRESSAAKTTDEKSVRDDQMVAMPDSPNVLSDSEIARIADVVNTGEIEQGQLAKTKAQNPQIKRFAEHMVTEHRKAKEAGDKIVKQVGIIPEEGTMATEMEDEGTGMLESLRSTEPGAGFDRLYIEAQVKQHQEVLDMLDGKLIPSTENAKLKAELEKTRSMVERHLTKARDIQQSLVD